MRVAQVAPLWARVPPQTYGGTERIVSFLTEELVRRGHEVTLFASGDSSTAATLRAVCPRCLFDAGAAGEIWRAEYYHVAALAQAVCESGDFDVVHCHLGTLSLPFEPLARAPMIHTLPSVLSVDDHWMARRHPAAQLVARSRQQIEDFPGANARVIYNGCDFDAFEFQARAGPCLAFLGRMAREKGAVDAIRIARRVGMPLLMAGEPCHATEQAYFREEVQPLIDGRQVRWIGPVDHAAKNRLLKDAAALLFPIDWDEPFGNVLIEAMACGTPVLACKRGSVAEVLDPGVTGFYADSPAELPALLPRVLALDRRAVREHAMARFNHRRMTDEYEELYEEAARRMNPAPRSLA